MKRGFWIVAALCVMTSIMCSMGRPADQEQSATVIETLNQVDAHPRPEDDWRRATAGMDIFGGGQVRTGPESSARLELLEGILRLWADSIFTVRENTTREGRLVTKIFLQTGRLWAHLTTEQPHHFTVETTSAVAAVRDTQFSVKVDPDQTTLVSVADGEVVVTAQDESVTVSTGQQTIVRPGQPPSPPEPMSDEELALWITEGQVLALASVLPTSTLTASPLEQTATPTPTPSQNDAPLPSDTPAPTNTPTMPPRPTNTPVPADTLTPVPIPTHTPVPRAAQSYLVASDAKGIYVQNVGTSERAFVTGGPAMYPVWSPDGTTIAFSCPADNQFGWEICLVNRDGTDRRYLTRGTNLSTQPHWLPDGQSLLLASYREKSTDIWLVNVKDGAWENLTPGSANSHEHVPQLVDGYQQMIFSSDRECVKDLGCIVLYISGRRGSDLRVLRGSVSITDQSYYPWRSRTVTQ